VSAERIDVFIQGARDASAQGRARLAAAIAEKFGLPRDKIEQGLTVGRVRVKAGADAMMAETLKVQLEGLGAIVALEPAPGTLSKPPPPVPPAPSARPKPSGKMESGLSAAYASRKTGENAAIAALDKIAQTPQESISLSKLDGSDSGPTRLPIDSKPAPARFSPPSETEEPRLELALPLRTPATTPPRPAPTPPPPQRPQMTAPPLEPVRPPPRVTVPPAPTPSVAPPATLLDPARKRWLIGLGLGLILGLLVAHLWGVHAEGRYDAIRADALAAGIPRSEEEYTLAIERQEIASATLMRAHSRARLTAGFLWLLVGTAVTLSWNRWGKPESR